MECLDANAVQDLMSGALDDAQRAAAIRHLDECNDCRGVLGALARESVREVTDSEPGVDTEVDPLGETRASTWTAGTRLEDTVDSGPPSTRGPDIEGLRLGRYRGLVRLGAGAMGVVYRADDEELGRRVALKLLKRPDRELTERLVREARAMAQVTHPNVVAVYEVGVASGSTYIAMELVDGTSLREWQRAPRPISRLLEVYAAAGRGLAAAHAAGIVHRDFKPDNVLVGADGRVRVTDFGLAASPTRGRTHGPGGPGDLGDDGIVDIALTTAGTLLGTPAYMAPEQFSGGNVDPRTDQFNFCVALYEALYGVRPFGGKSFAELGENVCEGVMTPPPSRSRVSSALRAIVLRGLAVKPGDRYPTMEHLLVELGRDRARPWRRAAIVLGAVTAALALWLVADIALRDRAAVAIGAAFRMTGVQTVRTLTTLQGEFYAQADTLYHESAVRQLAGHHDLADFGLGGAQADSDDLAEIHGQIESSDWAHTKSALASAQMGSASKPDPDADAVAIVDAKGRLIYSTASTMWGTRVDSLPQIKRALDTGGGASVAVLPYDDAAVVAAHLITAPRAGLAVIYDRALSLGADDTTNAKEARAVLVEIVDGARLLDKIKLDDQTRLALVAPDGRSIGDAPAALVAAAPMPGEPATTAMADDQTYQVQTLAIPGFEGQGTVARVVMANPVGGLTLFPHARLVFALLLLAALAGAIATGGRAHRMARA